MENLQEKTEEVNSLARAAEDERTTNLLEVWG